MHTSIEACCQDETKKRHQKLNLRVVCRWLGRNFANMNIRRSKSSCSVEVVVDFSASLITPAALLGFARLRCFAHFANSISQCCAKSDVSRNCWLGGCGRQWLEERHAYNERNGGCSVLLSLLDMVGLFIQPNFRFAAHIGGSNIWPRFAAFSDPAGTFLNPLASTVKVGWYVAIFIFYRYLDPSWFRHARQYVTWFPLETQFAQFCRKQFLLLLAGLSHAMKGLYWPTPMGERKGQFRNTCGMYMRPVLVPSSKFQKCLRFSGLEETISRWCLPSCGGAIGLFSE